MIKNHGVFEAKEAQKHGSTPILGHPGTAGWTGTVSRPWDQKGAADTVKLAGTVLDVAAREVYNPVMPRSRHLLRMPCRSFG
jgi:hypothetical protein